MLYTETYILPEINVIIVVAEIIVATLAFLLYKLLKRLYHSSNPRISSWASSLWVPALSLLVYSWLFLSLLILPWDFYFQTIAMTFHQIDKKQAVVAVAQEVELLYYYGKMFFTAGYIVLLSWFSLSMLQKWEADFVRSNRLVTNDLLKNIDTMFMFIRGAVYLVSAFVLMKVLDLNHLADGLFTTGAVGALFVSFAARDSISNVFGGFMILFDRPFRVGDYISSPDRNIEGVVERIGWRVTQVRTPKKTVKYVPNCTFSTVSIENVTRMSNRRVQSIVCLRYDDLGKVEKICQQLEKKIIELDFVDKRMSNFCTFSALGDYSVNLKLVVYTKPVTYREYNKCVEVVLLEVVRIVKRNHADFPFPTTTLDAQQIVDRLKDQVVE